MRPYPTVDGLPIPVSELGIGQPRGIELPKRYDIENHHLCFNAATMSRLAVTQALRDLNGMQTQMTGEQHYYDIHKKYSQPKVQPSAAYQRVHEAYEAGELIRTGSALTPRYRAVGEYLMQIIEIEKHREGY